MACKELKAFRVYLVHLLAKGYKALRVWQDTLVESLIISMIILVYSTVCQEKLATIANSLDQFHTFTYQHLIQILIFKAASFSFGGQTRVF